MSRNKKVGIITVLVLVLVIFSYLSGNRWGTKSDIISAFATLFALLFAYFAYKQSEVSNKMAKEALEAQLNPLPALNFALRSKFDDKGCPSGYELVCVNSGDGIAILSVNSFRDIEATNENAIQVSFFGNQTKDIENDSKESRTQETELIRKGKGVVAFHDELVNSVVLLPQEIKVLFSSSKFLIRKTSSMHKESKEFLISFHDDVTKKNHNVFLFYNDMNGRNTLSVRVE